MAARRPPLTFSGAIQLGTASAAAKDATFVAATGGSVDFTGVISENTSVTTNANVTVGNATNLGTVKFSNTANGYDGITTINGGTLEAKALAANGSNSSIGNGSAQTLANSAQTLIINGGTLKFTGTTGNGSSNRLFTIGTNGATIDGSSSDNTALTFTNTGSVATTSGATDRTLTLTGATVAATLNTIAGAIVDPSGGGKTAVAKGGVNTWLLNGANTYTGATTVTAGTLLVGGSLSGSMVAVNGGTFGGTGSVTTNNQSFTLASGAQLDPGTNGSTGLSINTGTANLDISAGVGGANTGALLYNLNGTTNSDKITLTLGALVAIGSGQLGFSDFAFTTGAGFGAGTYTLFSDAGLSGTLSGSDLTGTVGGLSATLGTSGNDIVLLVVPEPGSAVSLLGGIGCLLGLQRLRRRRV